MKQLIVEEKYNGKKIDALLFNKFNGLTLNTFHKALRKKDIKVNGTRINQNIILNTGDEIQVFIIDELLYKTFIPDIVYEDDNIIIVNKPKDIEVVGENSLTKYLRDYMSKNNNIFLEPCHRLDRNTTGLILFAKNNQALNILQNKFKTHEIEKHYIAKVYGIPKQNSQTLTAYLFKDNKKSMVYISDEPKKGYVKIITSYSILEKHPKGNYSILDVTLHTGKTHQIRAHLAHIGHPILGDGKYGINQINKKFCYNTQQLCSNVLKFNFSADAGILNYLNQKTIHYTA